MLPYIQEQGHDQQPVRPFHADFLGDKATISEPAHMSNINTINLTAQGASRMIGVVNNNYNGPVNQYYNNQGLANSSVLEWLWPQSPDPHNPLTAPYAKQNSIHQSAVEARRGQSTPWLINRSVFEEWFTGIGSPLWIWGKVGCGKTVLFSAIVSHIQSSRTLHTRPHLGYYYCRFQNEGDGEHALLLRRWIAQICDKDPLPESLQGLYRSCHDVYPARIPTSEELEDVLLDILRTCNEENTCAADYQSVDNQPKTFLLVDGLDELSEDYSNNEEVFSVLSRIACENFCNVFILVTSRDRVDIRDYLKPSFDDLEIDYGAVNDEISLYVLRAVASTPRLNRQSDETKEAIRARLADQANGMFLWAALQMRSLRSVRVSTGAAIYQLLQNLPKDLNETYNRIFSGLDEGLMSTAMLALKWVVLAKRPLFIEELVEACAFKVGLSLSLKPVSERLNSYNVFELLQDLVVIKPHLDSQQVDTQVPRTHTVTLAHVSLVEYLISQSPSVRSSNIPGFSLEEGHFCIASQCLSYLFHFNRLATVQDNEYVLLEYAWYNWEKHVSTHDSTEEPGRVRVKAMKFYQLLKCRARQPEPQDPHDSALQDFSTMLKLLYWLPHDGLQTMVHALAKPYFHPDIEEFLAPNNAVGEALRPLENSKSIRLLSLLPCIDREEPILCRLQPAKLEDQPDFDALSYVWGQRNSEQRIYVNGSGMSLTQNLFNILTTLRAQEINQTPRLWVDALCVNMRDIDEHGNQVRLLKQIYTSAKEVLFCLDDEKEEDGEGVKLLRRVGSSHLLPDHLYQDTLVAVERTGLEKIFQRRFWGRMWTVQEFVLAQRGTMLAGPHSVPIGVIEKAFQRLIDSPNVGSPLWQLFAANPALERIRRYIKARIRFQEDGFIDLPEILCWFQLQECSFAPDRIFSSLGLLRSDSEILHRIIPDYSRSAVEVFLDAAVLNLEHYGALNILSHAGEYRDGSGGPTWLPNYDHRRIPFTSCEKAADIFNAGGKCAPRLRVIQQKGSAILRVPGRRIDSVDSTTSQFPMLQDKKHWETFLAGQSFYGHRLSQTAIPGVVLPPTTEEEKRVLLQSSELKSWPNFRTDRTFFFTSSEQLGMGPRLVREGDSVVILAGGSVPYILRRLTTATGLELQSCDPLREDRYSPNGERDEVFDSDEQFPIIPCKDSNHDCYTFVGECYISGLMDGEAVEGRENDEEFWQTFCIH